MRKESKLLMCLLITSAVPTVTFADDIGHGTDGPNATDPTPVTDTSTTASFWGTVLEAFDFTSDE